jgi:hypothetical protein
METGMSWFRSALLATVLFAVAPPAAQPAPAPAPAPVGSTFKVDGWKYQLRPGDVHAYDCEKNCSPGSRVSYHLYPPDFNLTLAEFRDQQTRAVAMLQERLPPGSKIEIVRIDEEKVGDGRLLKSQRLTTLADGRKQHAISSFVFGGARPLSLISSADEEAAAKANFAQFLPLVTLVVNLGAPKR